MNLMEALIAGKLSGSGGGGGGGGADLFIATFSRNAQASYVWECDKTFNEVAAAYNAGKDVRYCVDGILSETVQYEKQSGDDVYKGIVVGSYSSPPKMYKIYMVDTWVGSVNVTEVELQVKTKRNDVSGATPSIQPYSNNEYYCGELTSLTITNPPATGEYLIVFYSGATPTTTTIAEGIEGLSGDNDSFTAEANKRYEISVKENYALITSHPWTAPAAEE